MRWLLCLAAALMVQPAAAAKLYKCVDAKGNIYYTDKLTPECLKGGSQELSKRGIVIKETDPVTGETKASGARSAEDIRAEQERQRRDKALLATYANEKEIDLARDRNLQQSQAVIQSIQPRLKAAQEKLGAQKARTAEFSGKGKPVPEWLAGEIADTERDVAGMQDQIDRTQKQMAEIKSRFDADKERYRELTGKQ